MKISVVLKIFLFSLFLYAKFLFAQTETMNLQWKSVQKQTLTNDSLYYLYFNGAIFESGNPGLPFFFKRERSDFAEGEIKVILSNKIFEELKPEDISKIKKWDGIKEDISVESYFTFQEKQPYLNFKFIPIIKNRITGNYEKLVSFSLKYEIVGANKSGYSIKQSWADNSVLKEGKWYKIAVNKNGIYKLTYEQLSTMGLSITDPRKIRVFGNGGGMLPEIAGSFRYDDLVENAIYVEGESDGSFDPGDYILFYGESPHSWYYNFYGNKMFYHRYNIYSEFNYYYINADLGLGKRISGQNSTSDPSNKTVNDFNDYAFHELDSVNFLGTGKDWFGERFDVVTEFNFPFSFPDLKTNDTALIKANVLTHSNIDSYFTITAGNKSEKIYVPGTPANDLYLYGYSAADTMAIIPGSSIINVKVKYDKPASSAMGFLDYIEVLVRRNLSFSGGQILFRDVNSVDTGNVADFILSNASQALRVWEITNPHEIKNQQYNLNGSTLSFRLHTDSLREFIAFNGSSFFSPELIGNVDNQNLHNLTNIDFIIVTHASFLTEANRLAEFHRTIDKMNVVVLTTEQVYNEFSSGKQDVSAIRNFAKMLYDKSTSPDQMPKNLLMFGDASYDYKSRIPDNTNFVPTFESVYSLSSASSWVTDDFFGLLDDNEGYNSLGNMDIGVGRLPVKSVAEAKNAVDKILRYGSKTNLVHNSNTISNMADWRNILCYVADDGENDGAAFMIDSENITSNLDYNYKTYNIDKIYLDAFQQVVTPGGPRYPDANQAINKRVLKGALIVNYIGHSGEVGWTLERVLGMSDINSWKNKYNMPVFFSASCSFSRFDDPALTSAGETVFLNPNGGGIALYSTTRLAYSGPNFTLAYNFYDTAFTKNSSNQYYTMGELMKIAKVKSGSGESIRNFTLIGDPALKMAYPQYKVFTTTINNDSVNSTIDTIKALSKVTVHGYVADESGNKLTSFNGILFPTVYDKFSLVRTLGNDPACPPYEFSIRKNILYKGKASVKNGDFSFSFIVPKDINYTFGTGKISYYAENGNSDAAGYFDNFIIGGSETNFEPDNQGPDIELFINDRNFKSGGITDENPSLLSFLFDEHGINTVGNGVGHDIIAVLDDNNQNPYVLNDYYQSDLDSYQRGSILYPLFNLDEGTHKLKIRAWDIYNNSSEASTDFIVVKSAKIALKNILNYPNPFIYQTTFRFEHNQADSYMDIVIQIFSINGILVKTIEQKVQTSGYIYDQITWDGTNEYGQKISPGVYIYKIKIGNSDNGYTEKSQKLVLIK